MHHAPIPTRSADRVTLREVGKVYPTGVTAIANLSLRVPDGQFLALLGPSGCGKSTLLRLIAGLEQPTSGQLEVARSAAGAGVAFVFQDAHLLPWRTVLQNVALPLELRGIGKADRLPAAAAELSRVGLGDALALYPAELSGGMRMRVSLARAMVTQPSMLLLDEPFAALDEITRHGLDDQLRALWLARKMTVLFVTHSIMEAAYLAQRAIVFSNRPARIVLDRTIDLPTDRPGSVRGEPAFAREMRLLYDALEGGARR
jgi:NitT/TauT family transport system ATP-binding protein